MPESVPVPVSDSPPPWWLVSPGDGGTSTCPMCQRTWTVTPLEDCMVPACGCYGDDTSAANSYRPCESCGLRHAWNCPKLGGDRRG